MKYFTTLFQLAVVGLLFSPYTLEAKPTKLTSKTDNFSIPLAEQAKNIVDQLQKVLETEDKNALKQFVREHLALVLITATFDKILPKDRLPEFHEKLYDDLVEIYGTPEKKKVFQDMKVERSNEGRPASEGYKIVKMVFVNKNTRKSETLALKNVDLWMDDGKVAEVKIEGAGLINAKKADLTTCFKTTAKRNPDLFLKKCFISSGSNQ